MGACQPGTGDVTAGLIALRLWMRVRLRVRIMAEGNCEQFGFPCRGRAGESEGQRQGPREAPRRRRRRLQNAAVGGGVQFEDRRSVVIAPDYLCLDPIELRTTRRLGVG